MKLGMLTRAAALTLILGLTAACGSSGGSATSTGTSEPVGVAVFLSTSANSYEQAQADGAKKAAEMLGAGPVQVFDGGFDSTKQVGQIQDATTAGRYKAFVIEPIDGAAVVPALTRAAQQGIKVVCITTACGADSTKLTTQFPGQTGVVGSDYAKTASLLAARAIASCASVNPCKVFYLNGDSTFPTDRAAKDSFQAVMSKAPSNVVYVGSQDGKYDTATGRSVMQAVLQRTPDLNVLASLADQQTLGAAQAIEAAGKSGQIQMISFGGSKQAVVAVQAAKWLAALPTVPVSIGQTGATIAISAAQGKDVPASVVDANTLTGVDGNFLTKENASSFSAQWVA